MPISYPRVDIVSGLNIRSGRIEALRRAESSTDADGRSFVKDLGPFLWSVSYSTAPMSISDAVDLETDLLTLDGGLNLFEGFDPRRAAPLKDDGSDLALVFVSHINDARTKMQLSGLPEGFRLSKGDYVSIDDGLNLHLMRMVEGRTAGASGETGSFEVRPHIRAGIQVGSPAVLRGASARFQIDPKSLDVSQIDMMSAVVSFAGLQVIL